jgi:hypothetical protein
MQQVPNRWSHGKTANLRKLVWRKRGKSPTAGVTERQQVSETWSDGNTESLRKLVWRKCSKYPIDGLTETQQVSESWSHVNVASLRKMVWSRRKNSPKYWSGADSLCSIKFHLDYDWIVRPWTPYSIYSPSEFLNFETPLLYTTPGCSLAYRQPEQSAECYTRTINQQMHIYGQTQIVILYLHVSATTLTIIRVPYNM